MKIAIIMPLAEQRGGGEMMLWHLMQQGRNADVEWVVIFTEPSPMVVQVARLGIEPMWLRPDGCGRRLSSCI